MADARYDANDVLHQFEQSMLRLLEVIAKAPRPIQETLLATARQRMDDAQIGMPCIPSTSRKSRALRRRFEKGIAIYRKQDEHGEDLSDAEFEKAMDLFYGTINEILRGGIRNDLELTTVREGVEYEMKKDGLNDSTQDAIDHALYVAFENTPTWPYAWLIGLARFQLRGFNAPWEYPEPKFMAWTGEGG